MIVNESWVYQGRQGHGYFGSGTAPKDDTRKDDAGPTDLFDPANAGQRVDYVASSLVMHAPRNDRGRWNSAVTNSARASLKTAVAAWYGARSSSRDAFRSQLLDTYTSDEVVDNLRSAAKKIVEGRTHEDLADAGNDLAVAAQKVGVDSWPRFLGTASRQAIDAVSKGDIPGVLKIGAGDGAASVVGLAFLGLLAIILGSNLMRPNLIMRRAGHLSCDRKVQATHLNHRQIATVTNDVHGQSIQTISLKRAGLKLIIQTQQKQVVERSSIRRPAKRSSLTRPVQESRVLTDKITIIGKIRVQLERERLISTKMEIPFPVVASDPISCQEIVHE